MKHEPTDLLTRQEVADYYKVTTRTIDNWTKSGAIAAPKQVGALKRWLFKEIEMK